MTMQNDQKKVLFPGVPQTDLTISFFMTLAYQPFLISRFPFPFTFFLSLKNFKCYFKSFSNDRLRRWNLPCSSAFTFPLLLFFHFTYPFLIVYSVSLSYCLFCILQSIKRQPIIKEQSLDIFRFWYSNIQGGICIRIFK